MQVSLLLSEAVGEVASYLEWIIKPKLSNAKDAPNRSQSDTCISSIQIKLLRSRERQHPSTPQFACLSEQECQNFAKSVKIPRDIWPKMEWAMHSGSDYIALSEKCSRPLVNTGIDEMGQKKSDRVWSACARQNPPSPFYFEDQILTRNYNRDFGAKYDLWRNINSNVPVSQFLCQPYHIWLAKYGEFTRQTN